LKNILFLLFVFFPAGAWALDLQGVSEEGMTLRQLLEAGGWVMIFIGLASILAIALTMFFLFTVRTSCFLPSAQLLEIKGAIETRDIEKVKELCRERANLLERAVYAGAGKIKEGSQAVRLRMEDEARHVMETYWQRVTYLSDIAVIAPMLGFLGTVTGMIQAFNAIAFKIGEVKPIFLAYGVSQAMITTAAGLIVGIFSMAFYFFFRSRIQNISARAESILESLADYMDKK
jgi:biopolymer transport protein ExbB